jgi:hypothetical protein
MTRVTRTAFSALASLDPIPSVRAEHGNDRREVADDDIEIQIARILAAPRVDETTHRGVRPRRRQPAQPARTVRATRRTGPRYGALGLVTSAALAVIATVLWVSPSAGQPLGQAGPGRVEVIHHGVDPGGAEAIDSTSFIR